MSSTCPFTRDKAQIECQKAFLHQCGRVMQQKVQHNIVYHVCLEIIHNERIFPVGGTRANSAPGLSYKRTRRSYLVF